MSLKTMLKQKNIKASYISRQSGIPYTTVSEIINGKVDIDRVQIGIGMRLAAACDMDFAQFYNICRQQNTPPQISDGQIIIKNKKYYLRCMLPENTEEIYLCKVNPVNTHFIKDMAEWTVNEIRAEAKRRKEIAEVEAWTIDSI